MPFNRSVGVAAVSAAALLAGASAHANITSISNGGIYYSVPPATIGLPNNNQASVVQGFDEVQGLTLLASLEVFSYAANSNVILAPGTVISSHMVIFDPVQNASGSAQITFDQPILGIIFNDVALFNTHALLGRAGVSYPAGVVAQYGFESTESATLINANTLSFSATASSPGDRFRVITVPTPGALALGGLGLIAAGRRRR